MTSLINLVKDTRKYLKKNYRELDLHIIHSFPNSGCETASLLLGKILSDAYPTKNINFVKGTNTKKYEMHFWIEVDEYTFDITADQFSGIDAPLIGNASKIIQARFSRAKRTPIKEALIGNSFSNSKVELFNHISAEVRKKT